MPAKNTLDAPVDFRRLWEDLREQVRSAWPIDEALRDLKGADIPAAKGDRVTCHCPFHDDKSPSFSISRSKGVYICHTFGCAEKGDLFELIKVTKGYSFREAVLFAAQQSGVPIPKPLEDGNWKPIAGARRQPREPEPDVLLPQGDLQPSTLDPIPHELMPQSRGHAVFAWNNGSTRAKRGPRKYRPDVIHPYIDVDGHLVAAILRIQKDALNKFFVPLRLDALPEDAPKSLGDSEGRGLVVGGSLGGEARPVYGMERVREWIGEGAARILVVEGEKTKDAAERMIRAAGMSRGTLVLSAMGGGNAVLGADWSGMVRLLAQANLPIPKIVTWPDADDDVVKKSTGEVIDRQDLFAKMVITGLAQSFLDAGMDPAKMVATRVRPPEGVESGWDLADAEKAKWHPDRFRDFLTTRQIEVSMSDINVLQPRPQFSLSGEMVPEVPEPLPFDPADPLDGTDEDDDCTRAAQLDAMIAAAFSGDIDAGDDVTDDDITTGRSAGTHGDDTDMPTEQHSTANDTFPDLTPDDMDILPSTEGAADPINLLPDVDAAAGADEDINLIDDSDDGDNGNLDDDWDDPILTDNPHFRCLGYLAGTNYFLSLNSNQIFGLNAGQMRNTNYFMLAPREWWVRHYPSAGTRGPSSGDWERVASELIRHSYGVGVWRPDREVGKGARMDRGRVVLHTGSALWVEGKGTMNLRDFRGENTYTVSQSFRMPEVEDYFKEESAEVNELLRIINNLNWRGDRRNLSIMSLFGWIAIAPLCGILSWRPHLWLDGPTSAGKSWIVENLIAPALGEYRVLVKSNSTESGLRNSLHGTSLPLVFDEAEGEGSRDKVRMEDIMKLARHSASDGDSVVMQGVPGGGNMKHYSIASMFLLASVTSQITAPADRNRFARAHLSCGLKIKEFNALVMGPAQDLFQPGPDGRGFSDKLIGRMLHRARDYKPVLAMMVEGLSQKGMERRLADVYGTFATGAWLALRDGVPVDEHEAVAFITEKFDAMPSMSDFSEEVMEDKDHTRIFSSIMSHELRFESRNGGARSERIGSLVQIAAGAAPEEDVMISIEEARAILVNQGMRMGTINGALKDEEEPTHVLIHKFADPILRILKDTPYAKGYEDVMQQAGDIVRGAQVRFGGNGVSRCLKVPLRHFHIEEPK